MVLFSATVLLATSCSLAILSSYSNLFLSFGSIFTFSNLALDGGLFYLMLAMYLWILLETM